MVPSQQELLAYLRGLADKVTEPYKTLPGIRGILLTGSVSYGVVDRYSDLDIILYYQELPAPVALSEAMKHNGAGELNWTLGDRAEGAVIESYLVKGVECQFAHCTVATWERDMDAILKDLDVESPIQKALSGILTGIPLYGDQLIHSYKARVRDYPKPLATAMVRRYLAFQPLWAYQERLNVRDGLLWQTQLLLEAAQNILGVLAGLNGLYYSTFQFKRSGDFIGQMSIKPDQLEARIGRLLTDRQAAIPVYRDLVEELVALVETHEPEVDTTAVRSRLARVETPWELHG